MDDKHSLASRSEGFYPKAWNGWGYFVGNRLTKGFSTEAVLIHAVDFNGEMIILNNTNNESSSIGIGKSRNILSNIVLEAVKIFGSP